MDARKGWSNENDENNLLEAADWDNYVYTRGDEDATAMMNSKFSVNEYRLQNAFDVDGRATLEAAFELQKVTAGAVNGFELLTPGDSASGTRTPAPTGVPGSSYHSTPVANVSPNGSGQTSSGGDFSFTSAPGLDFQALLLSYQAPLGTSMSSPTPDIASSSPALQGADVLAQQQAKMWAKIEKLKEVFYKGLEEYKASGELAEDLIPGLEGDTDSSEGAFKLSAAVIRAMDAYCIQNEMDAKLERQKFHELFQNLKRDNNKELRFKIFKGEISIGQLVAMDAKDLAPEALKRKRETESEKYFQQQVILKQDPKAAIIRKTHKGLEAVGGEDDSILKSSELKNKGTGSPSPTSSEGNSGTNDAEVNGTQVDATSGLGKSHFLSPGEIPWQNEMTTLLEAQSDSALPSPLDDGEATFEPPGKRPRTGDYDFVPPQSYAAALSVASAVSHTETASPGVFPEKSPSTSPAAFTQLIFRSWDSLAWTHRELFQKLHMNAIPSDPADGSLHQEVKRLQERLNWLKLQSERRMERWVKTGDASSETRTRDLYKSLTHIDHLRDSLDSHAHKISESMGIPLEVPNLILPAGIMTTSPSSAVETPMQSHLHL